jgi:hypothetical protein
MADFELLRECFVLRHERRVNVRQTLQRRYCVAGDAAKLLAASAASLRLTATE